MNASPSWVLLFARALRSELDEASQSRLPSAIETLLANLDRDTAAAPPAVSEPAPSAARRDEPRR